MAHAVVRTDNMAGTDVRAQLVSVKYMGAGSGNTPTAIDNGNVVKITKLVTGEREIYVGVDVKADDSINDVVLIASPEVMYEAEKHSLTHYVNEAGKICRGYHLHSGGYFAVTAEALSGSGAPEVNDIVELKAGTKLGYAKSLTPSSTKVGTIDAVEAVGSLTFYVIRIA